MWWCMSGVAIYVVHSAPCPTLLYVVVLVIYIVVLSGGDPAPAGYYYICGRVCAAYYIGEVGMMQVL